MNKKLHNKINIHKNIVFLTFIVTCCMIYTPNKSFGSSSEKNHSIYELMQQKRVTINIKNASLETILQEIRKQSGINYMLKSDLDDKSLLNLSLIVKNETIENTLNTLLMPTNCTFKIADNMITIIKKNEVKIDNHTKTTIKGKIVDNAKKPLAGAMILIKNTNIGVISDENGNYILSFAPQKNAVLQVTFVGYLSKEIAIKDHTEINVMMEVDELIVDDVVITGIYTRKAESFTGSAVSFKSKDLKMVGNGNVLQSLRTLDPSFNIAESTQFGSDPNQLPDVSIRGKSSVIGLKEQYGSDPNQPLFILDGFETTLQVVTDLNMDRIASVTILKDAASTAIYGSKAANGVVVIETKRPEPGKFKISYNGSFGLNMPDLSDYNLMNASEKLQFELEAGRYTATQQIDKLFLDSLYNARKSEVARGVDTYWMNEPLRMSVTHKHNIYADGGDDIIRYGIGATYNGNAGIMKNSKNNLAGINVDLQYRKGNLNIYNKLAIDYNTLSDPTVPFSKYANANPYYRKYDEDGNTTRYLEYYLTVQKEVYFIENPLYNASLNSFDEKKKFGFTENINAEYKILPTLIARGRFGLGKSTNKSDYFTSPTDTEFDMEKYNRKGRYKSGINDSFFYDGDFTVSYGQLFNKHQINAVIGAQMRSNTETMESNEYYGFPIGNFTRPSFSNGYKNDSKAHYSQSESRSSSFYFNGGYSFNNKYLVDANFRLDGSSVFGSNKRYTETWAVGLAWNVHQEKFMENAQWLNRLKIRGSIGNPGNQNFNAYQAYTTYAFNNWIQNPFGTSNFIDAIGNSDLAWEKTLDKNIGIDLTMLGNKLNITFDVYNKTTDPLLASIGVASSVGTTSVMTNIGKQTNNGFDGTIKYSPIFRPQDRINWTISANFRHYKAKYSNIGNSLDKLNSDNKNKSLVRYYDGGSPTSLWSVRSLGINPADGREVFLKKNGTYTFDYNTDDEVIVGNTEPKLTGVLGSSLYYKGFSFSLFFRYSLGGDVFNTATYNKVENISLESLKNNQDKRALYDRWRETGEKAKYKKISSNEVTPISSRFVMNENYIKAESISLGYDFKSAAIQSIGISALRLQINMNDLFRITSVKEERGIDYPFARMISMSLSLTF